MNLDLLIKLVKLANNNPNENEANLAARKVCKIIAEGKYSFVPDVVVNQQTRVNPPPPRPPQPSGNPGSSPFEEFFRQGGFRGFDQARKQDFYNEQYKRAYGPYSPFSEPDMPFGSAKKQSGERPSAERVCTKCGQKVGTFNVSKTPFVCGICQWEQWEKER